LTSLELMTEEVQVWVASLDIGDARYAELSKTLSREEQGRAETMVPALARRFISARGILRSLLSGFTGTAADKLRFTYGINVSHSAKLGLFAFAPDRPVGVDLENERPVRRLLDVAQRFMSEEEIRSLAASDPADRDTAFLKLWVVREARLKAEGKGVWSGSEAAKARASLTHKLFSPRTGYIAAVAASDSDWRLYTCAVKE